MTKLYKKLLNPDLSTDEMNEGVAEAKMTVSGEERAGILRNIFSFIDLTSLNTTDSATAIRRFAEKAASLHLTYQRYQQCGSPVCIPQFCGTCPSGSWQLRG